MKSYLLITLLSLFPFLNYGQISKVENAGKFGLILNTGFNSELYSLLVTPGVTYSKEAFQLELGLGINPFDRVDQSLLNTEMNFKYFPNGTANKFNLYMLTQFSYVKNERNTYYPATYHYLFLNAGYGFQIRLFEGLYLGTNFSIGTFSSSKKSNNPYEGFTSHKMLDEMGINMAAQFHLSYRF
jgi:hypothetical protein